MIHQNVDLYICEHCRLEFYDEEECLEHEKNPLASFRWLDERGHR